MRLTPKVTRAAKQRLHGGIVMYAVHPSVDWQERQAYIATIVEPRRGGRENKQK